MSLPHTSSKASATDADAGVRELYAAMWTPMVRAAWLLVRDETLAEDIVQDSFIAVHRKWHTIKVDRAPAYLRRTVVNRARSALRHRDVQERYLQSQSQRAHLAVVPSSENEALGRGDAQDLCESLRQLPRRQREVLVLRYYLDLSEREIAQDLGISPGSVKSHASRGLAALREQTDWRTT